MKGLFLDAISTGQYLMREYGWLIPVALVVIVVVVVAAIVMRRRKR